MPDNAIFYHIAYIAAAVIYGGYAATLYLRWKRVREKTLR
jgi:hypothetical protein